MESGEIIEIEVAEDPTQELLRGINFLLPQLSGSAQPLKLVEVEAMLSDESVNLLVASEKISGSIVGTLTLVVFRIPTGVRAWIEDVVTDSSIRGRGIAKKMVLDAIAIAKSFGAKTVDLTSRPSRVEANGLYVAMGFEIRDTNVYRYTI